MSTPRKHHFLPQFYLRGFSVDRRGIYQVRSADGAFHGCAIKDVGALRDFHELDGDDHDDPAAFERALAQVEAQQSSIVQQALCVGGEGDIYHGGLVDFVAVMRMRVPAIKAHVEESLKSEIRARFILMEKHGLLPERPAPLKDVKLDAFKFTVMNWKCLDLMFRMGASEKNVALLKNMRMTLFRAPFGERFVTSDQPVAVYHPSESEGVGTRTPGAEVTLPLSSRALLRLDNVPGEHATTIARSADVAEFNRRTMAMAQSFIYCGESPERVAAAIPPRNGRSPGFHFKSVYDGRGFLQAHTVVAVGPA